MTDEEIIEEFYAAIKWTIDRIDKEKVYSRRKLESLAFCILCMLDGISGSTTLDIESLERASRNIQLHEDYFQHC